MAEDLGVAKLELQVDLKRFEAGLADARRLISELNGEVQLNSGAKRRQRKEQAPPPLTQEVYIDVNRNSIKGLQEALSRLEERRIRLNVNTEEFKSATQLAERLKGRITELQTPTQFGRRRSGGASESIFALERAQNRRFALARRIDDIESKGGDVSRLRTQLGRVTEAQSAREFEAARRLSNELARQIVLAERRTKANREAAAAITKLQERGRSQGGPSENVETRFQAQKRRYSLDQQIRSLEAAGVKTDKLRASLGGVTEAQAKSQFGSAKRLSDELSFQLQKERDKLRVQREQQAIFERAAKQGGARSPVGGSLKIPGSPAYIQAQIREQDRLKKLEEASFARLAKLGGPSSPVRGRKDIEGSPAAIAAKNKAIARQIELDRRLAEQREQNRRKEIARNARQGGASSPISGRLRDGSVIEGSPAFKRLQEKSVAVKEAQAIARVLEEISRTDASAPFDDLSASARRASTSSAALLQQLRLIKADAAAATAAPSRPGASLSDFEIARRDAQRRQAAAPVGSTANVKATQDLARIEALITREKQRQEQLNKRLGISSQEQLKAANYKLKALSAETKASSAAADKRRGRLKDSVGSAIIGGAFPALFGQGIGASVGGGLGGLAGGAIGGQFGFGLSLIGTAVGAQVDAAVQKLGVLGSALKDPVANFQELAQAGLISSSALERNISALIANGKEAEAAALIQLDAAKQFGDTSDIEALSSANAELNRSFSQLSVLLAKLAAGPLADFTNVLANSFKGISEKGLVDERFRQASFNDQQRTSVLAEARSNTIPDRQGLSNAEGSVILYAEVNRLLDKQIGKTKEVAQAEALIAQAIERSEKLRSISFLAVDAEVFGNKELTLELEKQRVELERQQQIAAKGKAIQPAERKSIDEKAALETYRINQELEKLRRNSIYGLQEKLNQLNNEQSFAVIDSQSFVSATEDVTALQARIAEIDGQKALITAEFLIRGLNEGTIISSINNVRTALDNLNTSQATLEVDSSAFIDVTRQIVETEDDLRQLEGRKVIIEAEFIARGIQDGSISNSFASVNAQIEKLNEAKVKLDIDSSELDAAIGKLVEATERRDGLNLRAADKELSALQEGLRTGTVTNSELNLERQISLLREQQKAVDVNTSAYRSLGAEIQGLTEIQARYNAAAKASTTSAARFAKLNRVNPRETMVSTGGVSTTQRAYTSIKTVTRLTETGKQRLQEFRKELEQFLQNGDIDKVLGAKSPVRGFDVDRLSIRSNKPFARLDKTPEQARATFDEAGSTVRNNLVAGANEAKAALLQASDSLRSALRGSFEFLTKSKQQEVLAEAQNNIRNASKFGFDSARASRLRRPEDILSAGDAAAGLIQAGKQLEAQARQTQSDLSRVNREANAAQFLARRELDNLNAAFAARFTPRRPLLDDSNRVSTLESRDSRDRRQNFELEQKLVANAQAIIANTDAVNALANKDWSVALNVSPSSGATTVNTLNSLI